MSFFQKKMGLITLLTFALTGGYQASAWAIPSDDDDDQETAELDSNKEQVKKLNESIVELLKPFNGTNAEKGSQTSASVVFNRLKISEKRVVNVDVDLHYKKSGKLNTLSLDLDKVSYKFPETSKSGTPLPVAKLTGKLGFDFSKVLKREELDELADSASSGLSEWFSGYVEDFGSAASVSVTVNPAERDETGHVVKLSGKAKLTIDLKHLPEDKELRDVPVSELAFAFTVDLTGLSADVGVTLNPQFSTFESDQVGLKEHLENLLAGSTEELEAISGLIKFVDEFAEDMCSDEKEGF